MEFNSRIQKIDVNCKGWHDSYVPLFKSLCFPGATILDLGCGWRYRSVCCEVEDSCKCYGIDIDPLLRNQVLKLKIRASAHDLPFLDSSFDLIQSMYVLEHIEHPEKYFKESFRVLKKGGHLILQTNSAYNPVVIAAKIIPHNFHQIFISTILRNKRIDYDNAPVYYRSNYVKKLKQLSEDSGFSSCQLVHLSGMYEYFGNKIVRKIIIKLGNLLTNNRILASCKLNFILIAQK